MPPMSIGLRRFFCDQSSCGVDDERSIVLLFILALDQAPCTDLAGEGQSHLLHYSPGGEIVPLRVGDDSARPQSGGWMPRKSLRQDSQVPQIEGLLIREHPPSN
jgi:hypothetical protein